MLHQTDPNEQAEGVTLAVCQMRGKRQPWPSTARVRHFKKMSAISLKLTTLNLSSPFLTCFFFCKYILRKRSTRETLPALLTSLYTLPCARMGTTIKIFLLASQIRLKLQACGGDVLCQVMVWYTKIKSLAQNSVLVQRHQRKKW